MYTYERLLEIKKAAKAAKACVSQYKKFVEFLKAKDIKNAWATVMGNDYWCVELNVITQSEIDNYSGDVFSWYSDGKPEVKATYVNGVLHGSYEWFYENGQLGAKGTYVNGKLHGSYEVFYENGQLRAKGTYINGAYQ